MAVKVINETGPSATHQNDQFYDLQLSDKMGLVVRQQKYTNGAKQASINVSSPKADMYILRILYSKKWITKSVIRK